MRDFHQGMLFRRLDAGTLDFPDIVGRNNRPNRLLVSELERSGGLANTGDAVKNVQCCLFSHGHTHTFAQPPRLI